MRWLVVAGVVGAVLAGTATAQIQRADSRGTCRSTSVDIYYWPQGHPAVPSVGFPAFSPAHVEFYKGHDVSNLGQLGYMDVSQAGLSQTQCSAVADVPLPLPAGTSTQTTATTQKLRCSFVADADIRFSPWTGVKTRFVTRTTRVHGKLKKLHRTIRTTVTLGAQGSVAVTGATAAAAVVRLSNPPGKSSLTWDTRVCTAVPVDG